jgi:hypothetical protein
MLKKPGSDNRILWLYYKTRRKVHVLKTNGTLFHKTPKEYRRKNKLSSRLKRSRKLRRNLRHFFFYFRTGTVKRFNRRIAYEIKNLPENPIQFPRVLKDPDIDNAIPVVKSRPSFRKRIIRVIRITRYIIKKSRQRKLPSDDFSDKEDIQWFRKLRYLYHTGTIFKINPPPIKEFFTRNYSFLGKRKNLIIILNSTFLFLLAYLFVFIMKELAVDIAAKSFNINTVMKYNGVDFLIRSRDWTVDAVQVVYSVGPLIAMMITLITVIIFALISHQKWAIRLFIMWIFLQAFTQSCGEIIFGALFNRGFGWVLIYLYFDDATKMLMAIGIIIGMLIGGLFLSRFILFTGNIYFNFIGKVERGSFLMSQIFLPFLIGTGIITLIKIPIVNAFEVFVEGSMLLILLPAIIYARFSDDLFFDEEPRKIQIKWIWISISFLVLLLFRFFFWKGVRL